MCAPARGRGWFVGQFAGDYQQLCVMMRQIHPQHSTVVCSGEMCRYRGFGYFLCFDSESKGEFNVADQQEKPLRRHTTVPNAFYCQSVNSTGL